LPCSCHRPERAARLKVLWQIERLDSHLLGFERCRTKLEFMDDIIKDFLIESNENLDRLDRELVKLESDPAFKHAKARAKERLYPLPARPQRLKPFVFPHVAASQAMP
jgi:hypothetical protein